MRRLPELGQATSDRSGARAGRSGDKSDRPKSFHEVATIDDIADAVKLWSADLQVRLMKARADREVRTPLRPRLAFAGLIAQAAHAAQPAVAVELARHVLLHLRMRQNQE